MEQISKNESGQVCGGAGAREPQTHKLYAFLARCLSYAQGTRWAAYCGVVCATYLFRNFCQTARCDPTDFWWPLR